MTQHYQLSRTRGNFSPLAKGEEKEIGLHMLLALCYQRCYEI